MTTRDEGILADRKSAGQWDCVIVSFDWLPFGLSQRQPDTRSFDVVSYMMPFEQSWRMRNVRHNKYAERVTAISFSAAKLSNAITAAFSPTAFSPSSAPLPPCCVSKQDDQLICILLQQSAFRCNKASPTLCPCTFHILPACFILFPSMCPASRKRICCCF